MVKKIIVLALCLFICSCAKPLPRKTYLAAGTFLEVVSDDKQAAPIVHKEFKRLEKMFNFYDPKSELAKVNSSYNAPVKVSKEFIEIMQLSKQAYDLTDGIFDVTHGVLYDFWSEFIKQGKTGELPSKKKIAELKKLGGWDNIVIDPDESTILIKQQGLKIDLGGIAKGYMVDKASQKLCKTGIDSAIINAGGDLYCLGKKDNKPWSIGIKDPDAKEDFITRELLQDEAVATSGNYEQFLDAQGKRYSHIINPITGYPVEEPIISVSVVAKNCSSADAFATAFFVMGVGGIEKFIVRQPSTMKIFVVTLEGKERKIHIIK